MNLTKISTPSALSTTKHQKPLTYDVRYPENGTPKPVILFIHGFKGFKDWGYFNLMADTFAEAGFVFVKINLSHNGTTPDAPVDFADLEAFGQNNFSIELDDVGLLLDHILSADFEVPEEEIDKEQLMLVGHSRGGGLALLKASEDTRIRAVVTMAAVSDWEARWPKDVLQQWKEAGVQHIPNSRTGQIMPLYYQIVEDYYRFRDRLHLPKAIKRLKVPVLAFHGTEDETVPLSMAEDLQKWNNYVRLEILEGANHTFGGGHPYPEDHLPAAVRHIIDTSVVFFKKS